MRGVQLDELLARGKQAGGVGSPPAGACVHAGATSSWPRNRCSPSSSRSPHRNVGGNLLARCSARRVAQMAVLQRQLVQALGAARPTCKDSGRAVAWRHEHERQVKPSRFACMLLASGKIRRSLQPARERGGRARATNTKTWEVTCREVWPATRAILLWQFVSRCARAEEEMPIE